MRKISWPIYIATFLLTTIIFAAGIYVGMIIEEEGVHQLSKEISLAKQRSLDVSLLILMENSPDFCPVYKAELQKALEESYALGSELEYVEKVKNYYDVELKKKYFSLELRCFLLAEKVKELCDENYSIILYFYSRDCDDCERQGEELTKVRKSYPVMVFSFDGEIDSPIVKALKDKYKVSSYPTLIINGRKYSGLMKFEEVIRYAKEGSH